MRLNALPEGEAARIRGVEEGHAMSRRFLELGFTEGALVQCLYASPSGSPRAYWIRGTVIALRDEDAGRVLLEKGE